MKGLWNESPSKRKFTYWLSVLVTCLPIAQMAYADNLLTNIELLEKENNVYSLALTLESAEILASFEKSNSELAIVLKDTSVLETLAEQQTVTEGVLQKISLAPNEDGLAITLQATSHFGYDYFQADNVLTVDVFPSLTVVKSDTNTSTKPVDNGNISINFQDIPVRSVLQILADHNGFNLVISDSVEGSLTLRLDNVPWQKALETILTVKGLDKRQKGDILLIAPKTELDEQERLALEKIQFEREMASLRSEVIQIRYASAEAFKEMLEGDDEGEETVALLSERGSVAVDPRTNSLIVTDLADNIEVVKALLTSLDIPVDQVEIEARIVTVDEGTLDELGVRWGVVNQNGDFTTGSSIEGNWQHTDRIDWLGDGEQPDMVNIDDYLNVNLGAVSPNATSIAFSIANLGRDLLLDLELSALQSENRAEIISSPRLLTTNKRPAYIEQGTELPYLEASSSGATAVSFKKAVLSLSVTPQITPDNMLVLDLVVTQDKPSVTVKAGNGEAMAINTQRIGTQVLVNDGETIVLGGIFQHETANIEEKVPLLGDIPGLGVLFRRNYESVGKRELLIFVTPRVMVQ
ncbi:type IV pilus secretin PilQ [Enterovibrio nigricans]|uniref:Type IV pilus assembly protein PilQ n=1 Tax=Enterovibrio nigricans DSM 22720 TaxID=1121868 RepID=A0A1T4U8I2_9GAMM|nr:type IV pilus secretin PilQ [Enterovibrio nigricans]SKA49092.1 type IV pilus assembly protein PilQ [Enterovibrio nigricans DSM 22720]